MMLWTQIKFVAAIVVATMLLAGTGSVLLMRASANAPASDLNAPPPAPPPAAPASAAPFDSPFLQLVGCRIRQSASLKLTADAGQPTTVNWIEQEYPEVGWSIDPDLADKVAGYAISVTPTNDPASAQTLQAAKSAQLQSLVKELERPGEYDVKISAMSADSQPIASALFTS